MKEFGLSKKERIKSKKEFGLVFAEGKTIYSDNRELKAIYYVENNSELPGVKCAFAVHKKSGKAVWRNRVKRLLRESYRLNKHSIIKKCVTQNCLLLLIFSLNSVNQQKKNKIKLKDLLPGAVDLLNQIERDF
ncbi:ribonuclease P protein component [Bacteroidota bacterium]